MHVNNNPTKEKAICRFYIHIAKFRKENSPQYRIENDVMYSSDSPCYLIFSLQKVHYLLHVELNEYYKNGKILYTFVLYKYPKKGTFSLKGVKPDKIPSELKPFLI